MKRMSLLAALVLTGAVFAGDPPKIDAEVKAKPGRLTKLSAAASTAVKWINTSPDVDLIPDSNGKSAIFFPTKPGVYKIAVYTADATGPSDPAYCTVTVEGTAPVPDPVPDPVNPADPLAAELKALFAAEPPVTRTADAARLAGVYRASAVIAGREDVKTLQALKDAMAAASESMLAKTALVPIRKRLAPELASLGTDPAAALDDATRAKAKTLFTRIAVVLEGLK